MFFKKRKLHQAAKKGDIKKVKSLLEAGVDLNLPDRKGATALHWASLKNHFEVVKFLLVKKLNLRKKSESFK